MMRTLTMRTVMAGMVLMAMVSGCATSGGGGQGSTDAEGIAAALAVMKAGMEAEDVDKFMTAFSEDFEGDGGEGKDSVRQLLEGLADQGGLEDSEFIIDEAETTFEGSTAILAPIIMSSPMGEMELEFVLTKEADGVWRVTSLAQY